MLIMASPVGRNDPCPCGSGKKFKRCHLDGRFVGMVSAVLSSGPHDNRPSDIESDRQNGVPHFDVRNVSEADPCPCGSGKIFAVCHLPAIRTAEQMNMRYQIERREHEHLFGEVQPVVHQNYAGYKFVAVGNELHYAKESQVKTFPDFLMRYIATCLTPDWGNGEIKKALAARHPIMQWYDALCRRQRQFEKSDDGLIKFSPDGPSMAYMLLAYDLYVLRNHGALQKRVVARLKTKGGFQGARYELFATATCIRAGFDIQHEDETDGSKTHPEFTATHRKTGQRMALEAKSRHRPGVLGFDLGGPRNDEPKAGVRNILAAAIEKDVTDPLVAFIDVNLPPEASNEGWFKEVVETVTSAFGLETGGSDPFNLLVFTNQPYHYGAPGGPAPRRSTLNFRSNRPRLLAAHPEAILRVSEEAEKYGLVPNEFPANPLT